MHRHKLAFVSTHGTCIGPSKMAQQLSTRTALVEDTNTIPSTHDRQLTGPIIPAPGASNASGLLEHLYSYMYA